MEDKYDFGKPSKGKDTVCFKKFEYYKHKENKNSLQLKANRLLVWKISTENAHQISLTLLKFDVWG